ncbi:ubiquitin-conjugating enzyme E2 U-like [Gigantopelta aegis]|uniref:ubiquitin-conjugating enzyme E2 U-like n=1 Tax=Gigantopelta aegis TaxID=1735272 RepID=UPI001B8875CB|nr:ubiquitin-conjugating enzyme E2 U-like [Gigantopelta aegis]XP_041359028.1 ubiquitin-conjugating enzyme E2 U-like [Gigantopelta aegis]
MFSRAHLLIVREYERLQSIKPWGIEAHPLKDDNVFEWVAKIQGLKDSLWEGGIFHLYIKFDEHYSYRPPEICFHTVPFHPNVDMVTGRPCIDFLDDCDKWNESNRIYMILVTIQNLLSNPSANNPVNVEAAELMCRIPDVYKQVVQECIAASQRVEAGLAPHSITKAKVMFSPEIKKKTQLEPDSQPERPRITKITFDDYFTTWYGIATSKPQNDSKNPLLEKIKYDSSLQRIHNGLSHQDIEDQIRRQVQENSELVYGLVTSKPSRKDDKVAKMDRLQKMRKIYLPPRVSSASVSQDIELEGALPAINAGKDEIWEKEVDDLVAWTNNLDVNAIDT